MTPLTFHGAARIFTPFSRSDTGVALIISQLGFVLVFWLLSPSQIIPTPMEIVSAWNDMAANHGLLLELAASALTIWKAIAWSTLIAMGIACLSTMSFFRTAAQWLTSLRFLGFAGITFLFTLWTSDGASLKLWLLTFGMTVFLLTNMLSTVDSVTQQDIDYARTMRLGPWRMAYETIVRGKLADMLDLVRQNAAMGWTLLSMVEGLVRSEGGIGTLLLNQNRHFHLAAVFAIQITILVYGLAQDYLMKLFRDTLCPYVKLSQIRG